MQPHRLSSIGEYHAFRDLPAPAHPLLSVVRMEQIAALRADEPAHLVQDFYSVALKTDVNCALRYGQRTYDFSAGTMVFIAPGQVYSLRGSGDLTHRGWLLLLHPDLLWRTGLGERMKGFEYFGYAVSEALHLSTRD